MEDGRCQHQQILGKWYKRTFCIILATLNLKLFLSPNNSFHSRDFHLTWTKTWTSFHSLPASCAPVPVTLLRPLLHSLRLPLDFQKMPRVKVLPHLRLFAHALFSRGNFSLCSSCCFLLVLRSQLKKLLLRGSPLTPCLKGLVSSPSLLVPGCGLLQHVVQGTEHPSACISIPRWRFGVLDAISSTSIYFTGAQPLGTWRNLSSPRCAGNR